MFYIYTKELIFPQKSNVYIFRILGKNEFFFILWKLSDAFELDANVINFVYYGKTRIWTCAMYM